jgi:hypothetical protein
VINAETPDIARALHNETTRGRALQVKEKHQEDANLQVKIRILKDRREDALRICHLLKQRKRPMEAAAHKSPVIVGEEIIPSSHPHPYLDAVLPSRDIRIAEKILFSNVTREVL